MSSITSTSHAGLATWVMEMTALCKPIDVRWCDGSQAEWDELTQLLCDTGTFTRLNPDKRPNSFLARSSPGDVARVEDRTFICTRRPDQVGPTNNWADPKEMDPRCFTLLHEAANTGSHCMPEQLLA